LFTFEILAAPLSWTTYDIACDISSSAPLAIEIIGTKPAVCYVDKAGKDAMYAYASMDVPLLPGDWAHCRIEDNTRTITPKTSDLMEFNGAPVVVFTEHLGKPRLSFASSYTPATESDWTSHYAAEHKSHEIGVFVTGGKLGLAYISNEYAQQETDSVVVNLATVAVPAATPDWDQHSICTEEDISGIDVAVLQGTPAVVRYRFYDSPREASLYTTSLERPATAGDWASHLIVPVEPEQEYGSEVCMALVSNKPSAVFKHIYSTGDIEIMYTRSSAAKPTSYSDWSLHDIGATEAHQWTGLYIEEALGKPWVLYADADSFSLRVAQAKVAEPTSQNDWNRSDVDTADQSGNSPVMIEHGGSVIAAYYVDQGSQYDLRVAVYQP
jgi:hypothetical protein